MFPLATRKASRAGKICACTSLVSLAAGAIVRSILLKDAFQSCSDPFLAPRSRVLPLFVRISSAGVSNPDTPQKVLATPD
jgi:hypothetical protein